MTAKTWWVLFSITLLATLAAEFFIKPHASFGIDGTAFFHAWYGLLACAGIIVFSKAIGFLLKRKTDYYEGGSHD